ncbi:MAG: THO complex subunit 2 [Alyxoria varia]|nr:MAG: THO complex subunit 2 [Alyxoria varia]
MAPAGKRKRGDARTPQEGPESPNRPSPHRPGELGLAQRSSPQDQSFARGHHIQHNSRGGRRNPRGGRGTAHNAATSRNGPTPQVSNAAASKDVSTSTVAPQPVVESKNTQSQSLGGNEQLRTPQPPQNVPAKKPQDKKKPVPPKMPCSYTNITDDRLATWKENGRRSVIESASKASEERNITDLMNIFHEIIRSTLDFRIDATEAGNTVKAILESPPINTNTEGVEAFLDMLSVLTDFGDINESLKPFVIATEIPPLKLREILDDYLLKELGLVRSNFSTNFVRKQTKLLYRQSNYNLLREESEGFSKLMTELYTVANNESLSAEVVETTFENIKALIGAFDLDAGRVLDIILDAFASLLVRNTRFFVKFLRQSSYWPSSHDFDELLSQSSQLSSLPVWAEPWHQQPIASPEEEQEFSRSKEERDRVFWDRARAVGMDAYFELGGCSTLDPEKKSKVAHLLHDPNDEHSMETMRWIDATNTLPPRGNPVAAQLLGFKLRFYASTARDEQDTLPPNLIHLAALLIKIGFISLRDLYNHLYPDDGGLDETKEKKMKEKEEREQAKRSGGSAANALTQAGALSDDTLLVPTKGRERESRAGTPSSRTDGPAKSAESSTAADTAEPADQKVQLLESLLLIGAIPEALYILGRFPWLMDAFSDLPQYIHRLLHHSLSKVYSEIIPIGARAHISDPERPSSTNYDKFRSVSLQYPNKPQMPKILRRPKLEQDITDEGIGYRFYWEDWADNVPVCQTIDDLFTLCSTLLNLSGVKIGQDACLLSKICRLGKHSLVQDQSERNFSRWLELCKRVLCPALSQGEPNVGAANELFEVLKLFPVKTRYSVYAEWFHGATSRLPDVSSAFALAKLETKAKLKRISSENTVEVASALGRLTASSPGVVFSAMLTQIESYGNLVGVLVECPETFPPLGHDVFVWTMLSFLGKEGRSRLTSTGFSTSLWLQTLSLFIGKVCTQYSSVDILPILQYVLQQVQVGNYTDLRVLRELIQNMAGVIPDTDFTDAQVEAMGGLQMLQSITLEQVGDTRYEDRDSARRLVRCLVDKELAGPFLVGITQLQQMCPFDPNKDSTKVLSETFDEITNIKDQYLSLLDCKLDHKEFVRVVPDIASLISRHGIEPHMAFTIWRKVLAQSIADSDGDARRERKLSRSNGSQPFDQSGDTEMTDVKEVPALEEDTKEDTEPQDTRMADAGADKDPEETVRALASTSDIDPAIKGTPRGSPWHPILEEVMGAIRPLLSDEFESSMSLPFYVTFWQLSIQDITPASNHYTTATNKLRSQIDSISKDRSDVSVAAVQERETKKKFANEQLAKLFEEATASMTANVNVWTRLKKEKDHWFTGFNDKWRSLNTSLLQECFLRRCIVSPTDSFIASKLFWWMHRNGTPGFRTMHVLDQIFSRRLLTNLIYQCTGREAGNVGRFLRDILKTLSQWHSNRTQYEKGALGKDKDLPGFVQNIAEDGTVGKHLDYEDFRRLLQKWHKQIFDTIRDCVKNFEYMHVKNACTVMRSIYIFFPAIEWMGNQLLDAANAVEIAERPAKKTEGPKPLAREDVHVAVSSLLGCLKQRQKTWVTPQAFHLVNTTQRGQKGSFQTNPSTIQRSDSESAPKTLNAAAPEFEPTSQQASGSNEKPSSTSPMEVEDGEVKDIAQPNGASGAKEVEQASPQGTSKNETPQSEKPDSDHVKDTLSTPKPNAVQTSRTSSTVPTNMKESTISSSLHDRRDTPNEPRHSDTTKVRESRDQSPRNGRDRLDDPQQVTPSSQLHINGQKDHSSGSLGDGKIDQSTTAQGTLPRADQRQKSGQSDSRIVSGEASEDQAPSVSSRETSHGQGTPAEAVGEQTSQQTAPAKVTQQPSQPSNNTGETNSSASSVNPARAAIIEQQNKAGRDARPSQQDERRPGPANVRAPPSVPRSSRQSDPYHRREEPVRDDYGRNRMHAPYVDQAPGGPRSTRSRESVYAMEDHRSYEPKHPPPFARSGERPQSYNRDPSYGRLNAEAQSPQGSQPPYPERSDRSMRPSNSFQDRRRDSGGPPPRSGPTSSAGAASERDVAPTTTLAPQRNGAGRDQLRGPSGPSGPQSLATQAKTPGETTLHPSRVNRIEGRSEAPNMPPSASNAPSGPRSTQVRGYEAGKTGPLPSPTSREPPSGPQSGPSERTDGRRQFAGVRETLHQRGQTQRGPGTGSAIPSQRRDGPIDERGTAIRGRANAQRLADDPRAADAATGSVSTSRPTAMGQTYNQRDQSPRPELDRGEGRYGREPDYRQRDYELPPIRGAAAGPGEGRGTRSNRGPARELMDQDREMDREREREYSGRTPRLGGERGSARRGEEAMLEDPYNYGERERERGPRHRHEEYRGGREAPYGPGYEDHSRPSRRAAPPAEAGHPPSGSWGGNGRPEGRRNEAGERRELMGGANPRRDSRKRDWPGEGVPGPEESKRPRRGR